MHTPKEPQVQFNLATAIFPGYNDKHGIMICGYEWGGDSDGGIVTSDGIDIDAKVVFSNKAPRFGPVALTWPYDRRIIRWFKMWGHPLDENHAGDFEKCVLQTNWCDTQARRVEGSIAAKLLESNQTANFIRHIQEFEPKVIFFFGSVMIRILQSQNVMGRFGAIFGRPFSAPNTVCKPFDGRKFRIGFQQFERCTVVSLPHPSGSRGLSDRYIDLFTPEIGEILSTYKRSRDFR